MKVNVIAQVFTILAAISGAVVLLLETSYWMSHAYRPGPAPHIAFCGAAVLFLAIAQLTKRT